MEYEPGNKRQMCSMLISFIHSYYHEQSRPDRDTYVDILRENIKANRAHNFIKHHDTDTYGVPYDGQSIMHYG